MDRALSDGGAAITAGQEITDRLPRGAVVQLPSDFQAAGDGAWSATRAATTGTPAISGTATLSYAENSATRVGTFTVTGADEDVDEVTWAISGTDASHFDISTPKGALRLIDTSDTATGLKRPKMPDYESPDDTGADRSYSITLTATVGGVDATLAVTVAVTDVDEPGAVSLSPVRPKVGTALTATLSDPDTVSGSTTWAWQRSSGRNSWTTISGATSASYTPVAADSGQYLRVKATYTDGHGANKTAEATAHHVVIASVLTGLSATTTDTTLALTPGFEDDVLHYKISCGDTDTMTVTPTAATGVRLAIDGTQTTSGTEPRTATCRSPTVVRCRTSSPTCQEVTDGATEERSRGGCTTWSTTTACPATAGLIRWQSAVLVPLRSASGRTVSTATATGTEDRAAKPIPPTLDEDFQRIATVSHVSPLTNTGVHDFRVLLMSYEDRVQRDLSMGMT